MLRATGETLGLDFAWSQAVFTTWFPRCHSLQSPHPEAERWPVGPLT